MLVDFMIELRAVGWRESSLCTVCCEAVKVPNQHTRPVVQHVKLFWHKYWCSVRLRNMTRVLLEVGFNTSHTEYYNKNNRDSGSFTLNESECEKRIVNKVVFYRSESNWVKTSFRGKFFVSTSRFSQREWTFTLTGIVHWLLLAPDPTAQPTYCLISHD